MDPNTLLAPRVFVAASEGEWLPARVLEHSLKETSGSKVQVQLIGAAGRAIPVPADPSNRPRTPFSFQRFLVPELCGYQGRAIYLDADMLVFRDIRAVWDLPMAGHDLLSVRSSDGMRAAQFSVMLLDCANLDWNIEGIVAGLDEGRYDYEQLMARMCVARNVGRVIPAAWNCLERHDAGTCLLHYTDMDAQPWVSARNPLGHLWVDCLRRALDTGLVTHHDLQREVECQNVRPSLLRELSIGPLSTHSAAQLDRGFLAPYQRLGLAPARLMRWRSALAAGTRVLRRLSG